MVLYVVEVKLVLPPSVFDRRSVAVAYLRPPGHARLDAVPDIVERNLCLKLPNKIRTLRSRADQAHLAAQDADQLRQFVDAAGANHGTDSCDARVVLRRPAGHAVTLGIGRHAAKLRALEGTATKPHSFLEIEDRATTVELDSDRRQDHDRKGDEQEQHRHRDIEVALDDGPQVALHESVPVDEPAGLQAVDGHLASRPFAKGGEVEHRNAANARRKQLIHRQADIALLPHRNDDLVDPMLARQFVDRQVVGKDRYPRVREHRRFRVPEQLAALAGSPDGIEAHQHMLQGSARSEFDGNVPRFGTGSDDENASRPEGRAPTQVADAAHGDEAEEHEGHGEEQKRVGVAAVADHPQREVGDARTHRHRHEGPAELEGQSDANGPALPVQTGERVEERHEDGECDGNRQIDRRRMIYGVRVERQGQSIDGQHDRQETERPIGDDFHEQPHRNVMLEYRHHPACSLYRAKNRPR